MEKLVATHPAMGYYIAGRGPVVVLLHGFCENKSIWYPAAKELQQHFTLIVPDLPGFGASGLPDTTLTMEYMADMVSRVLELERVKQCVMVGHSMGGYVTLAFMEKYAGYLKGAGLFHSTAAPDDETKKANRLKTAEFVRENGVAPFVRTLAPTLFSPRNKPDERSFSELLAMMESCSPEGVMAATLAMRARPDRTSVLKGAAIPVLFAAGIADQTIAADAMLKQASITPVSVVEMLNHSGHLGMLEEPERTADILKRFVHFCYEEE